MKNFVFFRKFFRVCKLPVSIENCFGRVEQFEVEPQLFIVGYGQRVSPERGYSIFTFFLKESCRYLVLTNGEDAERDVSLQGSLERDEVRTSIKIS